MISKNEFEKLGPRGRRKLNAYINFLLFLQGVPVLHDVCVILDTTK